MLIVFDPTHCQPKVAGDSTEKFVCNVQELVFGQNSGIAQDWLYKIFRWLVYNHNGYIVDSVGQEPLL